MRTENKSIIKTLLATAVAVAASCATEPPPRPAQLDPSNPSAPESAPLTAGALAQPANPVPHRQPGPGARLYTCPMHPEVISDKPGTCPKCGMTLVPKEPSEEKR